MAGPAPSRSPSSASTVATTAANSKTKQPRAGAQARSRTVEPVPSRSALAGNARNATPFPPSSPRRAQQRSDRRRGPADRCAAIARFAGIAPTRQRERPIGQRRGGSVGGGRAHGAARHVRQGQRRARRAAAVGAAGRQLDAGARRGGRSFGLRQCQRGHERVAGHVSGRIAERAGRAGHRRAADRARRRRQAGAVGRRRACERIDRHRRPRRRPPPTARRSTTPFAPAS